MSSDLQVLFSFAVMMLGAVLLISAYFEASEFGFDFEKIDAEKESERNHL